MHAFIHSLTLFTGIQITLVTSTGQPVAGTQSPEFTSRISQVLVGLGVGWCPSPSSSPLPSLALLVLLVFLSTVTTEEWYVQDQSSGKVTRGSSSPGEM